MTQFLPPNLLALFKPRDPIPYLPPVDKLPYEKKTAGYTGIAAFMNQFEDPSNTPPPLRIETREERQERRRREKAEQMAYKLEQDIALWDPSKNPNSTADPYKTLFVARINYDTSEAKLRREFELYGKIRRISIIYDIFAKNSPKPRGYAFIEYDRERDMHSAYKHADGRKIDGRRVLVDVERGRTVKGWLPRRLGGGLGGTRRGGPEVNVKHSGREEPRPEDRYMNRDRDRAERPERPERPEHRSSRSRSRERRVRSRSRSRDRRPRRDRHKRDRSRERERPREHEAGANAEKADIAPDAAPEAPPDADRRRRRSRSRDRERRRSRRSRSRDRKKRDYDKDRESRRERERPSRDQEELSMTSVKEEPIDDYDKNDTQDNYENNGGFENNYKSEYNNYDNMENAEEYEGY